MFSFWDWKLQMLIMIMMFGVVEWQEWSKSLKEEVVVCVVLRCDCRKLYVMFMNMDFWLLLLCLFLVVGKVWNRQRKWVDMLWFFIWMLFIGNRIGVKVD